MPSGPAPAEPGAALHPALHPAWRLAVAVAVVQVAGTVLVAQHQRPERPLDALAVLLLATGPAAILGRERWPVGVLVVAVACTATYVALGYPGGPIWFAMIAGYVHLVVSGRRYPAYAVLLGGYLLFLLGLPLLRGEQPPGPVAWAALAAWLLFLLAGSEWFRSRGAYAAEARQRRIEAERVRAEEEQRRESEERLAIARELHDVLAHSISMINVQAGVALELMDGRPERAREALTAIKAASRDALVEVQGVLDSLRRPAERPPTSPAPAVSDLDELLARCREAGLDVVSAVEGEPVPLPAAVDAAAARIVQEALTNVARHSAAGRARVLVRYEPALLRVTVDDDGPAAPPGPAGSPVPGGGRGIAGMRERVTALGGGVTAGPRPGGGFRVAASLPLTRTGSEVA